MTKQIIWLDNDSLAFPPLETALDDPNGLLAAGGNLSSQRLLAAYRLGIFPWFEEGQPLLWWSPDPRSVLFPQDLHISRSLRKTLRCNRFTITADRDFEAVIRGCAEQREYALGTWITEDMVKAYLKLFEMGYAHSIEVWQNNRLMGGLYGIALGKVFFGESMFSRETDASKVAFVYLVRQLESWGFQLIDCQVQSQHLTRLGATAISRQQFAQLLLNLIPEVAPQPHWELSWFFKSP